MHVVPRARPDVPTARRFLVSRLAWILQMHLEATHPLHRAPRSPHPLLYLRSPILVRSWAFAFLFRPRDLDIHPPSYCHKQVCPSKNDCRCGAFRLVRVALSQTRKPGKQGTSMTSARLARAQGKATHNREQTSKRRMSCRRTSPLCFHGNPRLYLRLHIAPTSLRSAPAPSQI